MLRFFLFIMLISNAVSIRAMDLPQLLVRAKQYDVDYIRSESQYSQRKQDYYIARSELMPNLSVSASKSKFETDNEGRISLTTSSGHYDKEEYSVQFNQLIYSKSAWDSLSSENLYFESARAKYLNTKQNLILQIVRTYFSCINARNRKHVAQKSLDLSQAQFNKVKKQVIAGLSPRFSLRQAKSDLSGARSNLIKVNRDFEQALAALQVMVMVNNMDFIDSVSFDFNNVRIKPMTETVERWVELGLNNNAALQEARLNYAAVKKRRDAKKAEHLPTLNFTARYIHSEQKGGSFDGSQNSDSQYSINLTWPLYSGGRLQAETKKLSLNMSELRRVMEMQYIKVQQDIKRNYIYVKQSMENYSVLKEGYENASKNERSVAFGVQVGSQLQVDFLEAQRKKQQAYATLAEAYLDLNYQHLNLLYLAGSLTEENLTTLGL